MAIQFDRKLVWAAATDAGNRNARKNGRSSWNDEDRQVAVDAFHRLAQASF
jgi:hypothetical protein